MTVRSRIAHTPLVLRIAAVYVAARVATALMFMGAAALAGDGTRFGPDAHVADFVVGWDAQWYWWIAVHGYPSELPTNDQGVVGENAWAFMPVYPWLAQIVGAPLGAWGLGALLVSLLAGFGAAYVLHRLLEPRIGANAAMWAVIFFVSGPVSPLFQVGYAESLTILLLLLALWCVTEQRFGWLYLIIPVMGFTRPGVLAFALFLGLYGIMRWVRRAREPLPRSTVVHIVALGALATVVGFSWPVIAGVVTGNPQAYFETELSWRHNWSDGGAAEKFVPFEGWVDAAMFWARYLGAPGVVGLLVLVVVVAAVTAVLLVGPGVRKLGPEVRLWSASYMLYLLAVFYPQSSTLRLLFPLTPLWGAVAARPSRLVRATVLVLCLVVQWLWIYNMYALGNTFWRVP